jgi:Glycine-rich domain-containing protein-like
MDRSRQPRLEKSMTINRAAQLRASHSFQAFDLAEIYIKQLDLEPIKYKLVMDQDGPLWSLERAGRAELAYKQFLTLIIRYPQESIIPLGDIDTFWHQHILDTAKYADDCQLIFGRFLHHFPYFGLRGSDDAASLKRAGEYTRRLFFEEFANAEFSHFSTAFPACDSSPEPGPASCTPVPSCSGDPDPTLYIRRPRFDRKLTD